MKEKAIICDLDGTLALLGNRNPYDASKAVEDKLNKPIARILQLYDGKILIVSGRYDTYREQTIAWLKTHNIQYEQLFLREAGDSRKDFVVKKEIFDTHIKEKYEVEFTLDDRDQSVAFWRSLGFTCLQVAPGNF
jgi:adenylate cyclase class IV